MQSYLSVFEKHENSSPRHQTVSSSAHVKTTLLDALRRRKKLLVPLLATMSIGCQDSSTSSCQTDAEATLSCAEEFSFNAYGQAQTQGSYLPESRQPLTIHVGEMNPWLVNFTGGRHEEYGAHIIDTYADQYSGYDVHGRLADVNPFTLSSEFSSLLRSDQAYVMSLSQYSDISFNRTEVNRVFDQQSEAILFASAKNMTLSSTSQCRAENSADARNMHLIHQADTLVKVGTAVENRDGSVDLHRTVHCSQASFTVSHPSITKERPYIYWRTRDEYEAQLNAYPNSLGRDTIAQRLAEYDEKVANGQIEPGEMTTNLIGNSFAAPHAGGMGAAMLVTHPNFDSQEAYAVLLSAPQPFNISYNGSPIVPAPNGAGFYYDNQSAGFGHLRYEILEKRARLMDDVLQENPQLETVQTTFSVQGQKIQGGALQSQFSFTVDHNFIGYRAILNLAAVSADQNRGVADVTLTRPDGYTAHMSAKLTDSGHAVLDTEQVFGADTYGTWDVVIQGDFQSVTLDLKGVEKGGPVDLFLPRAAAQLDQERSQEPARTIPGTGLPLPGNILGKSRTYKKPHLPNPKVQLVPR